MFCRVPSCKNCIYSIYYKGYGSTRYDPGEPDMWECNHEKASNEEFIEGADNIDWEYEKMPAYCGVYQPIIVEKCENCKKDINVPKYQHKIYHTSLIYEDLVPCCSKDCKDAMKVMDKLTIINHHDYI